ncbi:MAG: response regulator [Candidatus Omnitrophica bacterium]|nr:response regulator [Candidatus Omnitrophota bacterium]
MSSTTTNPIKILVVDDKKVIQDFFDFTLGYYGHQITVVHNPKEVVGLIKEKTFDIVFLDMVMPERSGIEVLKDIKSESPHLPVVMMSGYSVQEQKDEAVRLGAQGCLKKPFELEDIRLVIKQVINRDVS